MRSLLVYATNSGGTYFAAKTLENALMKKGYEVSLCPAVFANPDHFADFDLIVFGSCTWNYGGKEGQMHQHFTQLKEKIGDRIFPDQKFAVFALGDDSYHKFAGAADCLEVFVQSLRGKQSGESLRIDRFYADQSSKEEKIQQWASQVD